MAVVIQLRRPWLLNPPVSLQPHRARRTASVGLNLDLWMLSPKLTIVISLHDSRFRVAGLAACQSGQPRHSHCHTPRGPWFYLVAALSTDLQLSFSEQLLRALVIAPEHFIIVTLFPCPSHFLLSGWPSTVHKRWYQRCSNDPRSLLDQVPSVCSPRLRKESSFRRCRVW